MMCITTTGTTLYWLVYASIVAPSVVTPSLLWSYSLPVCY